jgi:hypothetical protein
MLLFQGLPSQAVSSRLMSRLCRSLTSRLTTMFTHKLCGTLLFRLQCRLKVSVSIQLSTRLLSRITHAVDRTYSNTLYSTGIIAITAGSNDGYWSISGHLGYIFPLASVKDSKQIQIRGSVQGPGWNQTVTVAMGFTPLQTCTAQNLWFFGWLHNFAYSAFWLKLCICILIVSQYNIYIKVAVLHALSTSALQIAIQSIFI